MMRVDDLMSRQVKTCVAEDTLEKAAQLMWSNDCGCLPVSAGANGATRMVGMITDRDICMHALFQHKPLSDLHVADAMAKKLLSCRPGDPVEHAEELMRSGQIRRLPVIDEQGVLAGLITLGDIAREATRERARPSKDVTATEVGDTLAAICASPPRPLAA